jgi:hypothetical protein
VNPLREHAGRHVVGDGGESVRGKVGSGVGDPGDAESCQLLTDGGESGRPRARKPCAQPVVGAPQPAGRRTVGAAFDAWMLSGGQGNRLGGKGVEDPKGATAMLDAYRTA